MSLKICIFFALVALSMTMAIKKAKKDGNPKWTYCIPELENVHRPSGDSCVPECMKGKKGTIEKTIKQKIDTVTNVYEQDDNGQWFLVSTNTVTTYGSRKILVPNPKTRKECLDACCFCNWDTMKALSCTADSIPLNFKRSNYDTTHCINESCHTYRNEIA